MDKKTNMITKKLAIELVNKSKEMDEFKFCAAKKCHPSVCKKYDRCEANVQ